MGPSCPLTTVPCFEYSKGSSKFSHLQVKFLPSLGGWVHKSVTRCVHHACPVGQTWPDDCFFINKVLLEHSYAQSFYVSLWQLLLWNGRPALRSFTETACWPLILSIMTTFCAWGPEVWTRLHSLNYRKQQYGCCWKLLRTCSPLTPTPRVYRHTQPATVSAVSQGITVAIIDGTHNCVLRGFEKRIIWTMLGFGIALRQFTGRLLASTRVQF